MALMVPSVNPKHRLYGDPLSLILLHSTSIFSLDKYKFHSKRSVLAEKNISTYLQTTDHVKIVRLDYKKTTFSDMKALEVENKKEELDILRLKTVSENEERMECREIEAQNKKEELQILRLKTEAEVQEPKQI